MKLPDSPSVALSLSTVARAIDCPGRRRRQEAEILAQTRSLPARSARPGNEVARTTNRVPRVDAGPLTRSCFPSVTLSGTKRTRRTSYYLFTHSQVARGNAPCTRVFPFAVIPPALQGRSPGNSARTSSCSPGGSLWNSSDFSLALKGRPHPAQGNALGKPFPERSSPERAIQVRPRA
jgi:hypothetical protein